VRSVLGGDTGTEEGNEYEQGQAVHCQTIPHDRHQHSIAQQSLAAAQLSGQDHDFAKQRDPGCSCGVEHYGL